MVEETVQDQVHDGRGGSHLVFGHRVELVNGPVGLVEFGAALELEDGALEALGAEAAAEGVAGQGGCGRRRSEGGARRGRWRRATMETMVGRGLSELRWGGEGSICEDIETTRWCILHEKSGEVGAWWWMEGGRAEGGEREMERGSQEVSGPPSYVAPGAHGAGRSVTKTPTMDLILCK